MTPDAALVAARLVHFAALLLLFGVACFPLYAFVDKPPGEFRAWRRGLLMGSALAALLSGGLWLAFATAQMSGEPRDAFDPSALASVISDTDFGKLWALRLMGCALLAPAALWRRGRGDLIYAVFAGLLLASLAATGHGALSDGPMGGVHMAGDALHLLAAGLWIGALWALGWLVVRQPGARETETALRRFSGLGQLAVAVLVFTGLANAFFILGDLSRLFTSSYGLLLDLKLFLFAVMIVLAGMNRFVLVPRLRSGPEGRAQIRLKHHILGEQALALLVILVVALLGTLDPQG